VALSLAGAPDVTANPVTVSYVDVATQCVDPPNVALTEEVGKEPPFPVGEKITYTVALATVGDCTIPPDLDGKVNDGCPAVGPAESGAQCNNNTDDDGDGKVNDGCPAVGPAESGAQCDNNTDDDPPATSNDYQVTATNMSGHWLEDVFVVADTGTDFGNWDGNIAGSHAKKIANAWPCGGVITFSLMNVAPNVSPTFDSIGVPTHSGPTNFSIVANTVSPDGGCCTAAANACCQTTATACNASGGHYLGAGIQCTKCGACCRDTNRCDSPISDIECHALPGGHFMGNGTISCAHNLDGSCKLGACCGPDNVCTLDKTEEECIKLDGRYLGDGTTSCPDNCSTIPTVSEWGLVVMGLLVLSAATVVIMRRRAMVRGGS
jgi:hypothetical protein